MMLFVFQAVNLYKISWMKAAKTFWFSLAKLYFCCSDGVATLFYHVQPKKFQGTFNFSEFMLACKKLGCFINLFWRNG